MLEIKKSHAISRSKDNDNYFIKCDGIIIAGFKNEEDAEQFCFLKRFVDKDSLKRCYLLDSNLSYSYYPSDNNEDFTKWLIDKILNNEYK